MLALALSLGHNSSAVLIENGKIKCGYEEERISGIKADSSYPVNAIKNCLVQVRPDQNIDKIFISHWSTYGDYNDLNDKHFDRTEFNVLRKQYPDVEVYSHDKEFTHHDAHMEVANVYSENMTEHTIVADGFGNFNEVLSIYEGKNLIFRSHGYGKSLGLLYQYTTAYLGMKMNQDEYKLLGYEAHILDVLSEFPQTVNMLRKSATKIAKKYVKILLDTSPGYKLDSLLDSSALIKNRRQIERIWNTTLNNLGFKSIDMRNSYHKKVIVSFLLQKAIEMTMIKIIERFEIRSVCLVGGIFYNVKLNKAIMDSVAEICVCPLAGDQGAGLGVYQKHEGNLQLTNLDIGIRTIDMCRLYPDNVKIVYSVEAMTELIDLYLQENFIVNLVYGNMEFGPRALGNTSTLMLPTIENVEYINKCNGRNTIMPCAPITIEYDLFRDSEKVIKSLEHMIMTLQFTTHPGRAIRGAAHNHPTEDYYTGRPQFIYPEHHLYGVLSMYKTLVNTSFNIHGQPIIFSTSQLVDAVNYQNERDDEGRIQTVIVCC